MWGLCQLHRTEARRLTQSGLTAPDRRSQTRMALSLTDALYRRHPVTVEPAPTRYDELLPLILLIYRGSCALKAGKDAVKKFLRGELRLASSQLARLLMTVRLGSETTLDTTEVLRVAAEALWKALCALDPECMCIGEQSPRDLCRRSPPFWRRPPDDGPAYLHTAVKRMAKRLVAEYGTSVRLGVHDHDPLEMDHRKATRLERGDGWVNRQRTDLSEDFSGDSFTASIERFLLLFAQLSAHTRRNRERLALQLIAQTGDVPYSIETAGLTRGEYRALQDRLQRNVLMG